jgi:hypothetical protein
MNIFNFDNFATLKSHSTWNKLVHFTGWNTSVSFTGKSRYFTSVYIHCMWNWTNICYFLPMCYVQTHCSSNGSFHLAQIYITFYPCVMFKHTVHQMVHFTLLNYMLLSTHVLCSNTLFIKWFISPCSSFIVMLPFVLLNN